MGKTPKVFDEQFKRMATALSYAKGSIRAAAEELDIDASLENSYY